MQQDTNIKAQYTGEEIPNIARRYVNESSEGPLKDLKALTPSESRVQSQVSSFKFQVSKTAAEIIDPDLNSATIFCKGNDEVHAFRVTLNPESGEVASFTVAKSNTLEGLDQRLQELRELEEQLTLPALGQ